MSRGALLVLEGPEGVGKTTQIALLAESLRVSGITVTTLREPGGTDPGEAVRSILLDPAMHLTPVSEALLFLASRAELVAGRIIPALDRGEVVILDRFFLSTYAYQIAGRELDEQQIVAANQLAVRGLVPDINIVLDLDVTEGMRRANARSTRDRMELAGDAFHVRVGRAFREFTDDAWQARHPESGVVVAVDASGTEREVAMRVSEAVMSRLPRLGNAPAHAEVSS